MTGRISRDWLEALEGPSIRSWKPAAVALLLCSGVAWTSLASATYVPVAEGSQWRALAVAPLARGGTTGIQMSQTNAVQPTLDVPHRALPLEQHAEGLPRPLAGKSGPTRIRGSAADGLYFAMRAAGVSAQAAAEYLAALATEIDVGEIGPADTFDVVLGGGGELLYAGLQRIGSPNLELVKFQQNGRVQWIDAANRLSAQPVEAGFAMPARGPITSYFGYRYHPILHFTRFHAGVDIGAGWGSPIVAAGDGQVVAAGWSGGFGREVQIAHGGGVTSIYGHMSEIVARPGSVVRAGELIGYVGSSGLSTGPHLHFEVRRGGTPVNPLDVRFTSTPTLDPHLAGAVKARLATLLSIATKG